MFKKYGHYKSRLDEKLGKWCWGIWWEGKFKGIGEDYSAHLMFTNKSYIPDEDNVVRQFILKYKGKK